MDISLVVSRLEREWDFESGFFGLLRRGEFDRTSLQRLLAILEGINFKDDGVINRRLVSLLWFMPLFMEWQKERVQEQGCDMVTFEKATNQVHNHVERLLGLP